MTLGIYGCVEQIHLKQEVSRLEEENIFLNDRNNEVRANAKNYLNIQLNLIQRSLADQKITVLRNSDEIATAGDTQQELYQKINEAVAVVDDAKDQVQIKQVIVDQLEEIERDVKAAHTTVAQQTEAIVTAKKNLVDVKARIQKIQSKLTAAPHDKLGPFPREVQLTNWILWQSKITPDNIPNDPSTYHNDYQGLKSAYQVIEASFSNCFDRLLDISSNNNLPIVFNKSANIFANPKCKMNMTAVYRFMAYDLIQHSKIINDHTIQLNDQGLTMYSSCPENVCTYKEGTDAPDIVVNFKYHDQFTPPAGKELAKGIDPVLAKQVFLQMNDEEKDLLLWMLLEPLIPDDNEGLIQRLEQFKGDSNSIRKVRACYEKLCDMGAAIDKKFGPTLGFSWLDKADDYEAEPLIKKVEEIIPEENSKNEPIVEWKINIDAFKKVDPAFANQILKNQDHYKRIWANMSKGLLVKPFETEADIKPMNGGNFKAILRQQFYVWYQMLDGHYCLLSALCAITQTDPTQFTAGNVTKIHRAMAHHLDNPEVAERFKSLIQSEHSMTVKQYQNKLQQSYVQEFLGDTEISIFADLMCVRVIVFFPEDPKFNKVKLDEYGLQTPISSVNYFGPNTKERLYVTYQTTGQNYYYTFPRLKTNVLSGVAGDSVKTVDHYWSTVRHNGY